MSDQKKFKKVSSYIEKKIKKWKNSWAQFFFFFLWCFSGLMDGNKLWLIWKSIERHTCWVKEFWKKVFSSRWKSSKKGSPKMCQKSCPPPPGAKTVGQIFLRVGSFERSSDQDMPMEEWLRKIFWNHKKNWKNVKIFKLFDVPPPCSNNYRADFFEW